MNSQGFRNIFINFITPASLLLIAFFLTEPARLLNPQGYPDDSAAISMHYLRDTIDSYSRLPALSLARDQVWDISIYSACCANCLVNRKNHEQRQFMSASYHSDKAVLACSPGALWGEFLVSPVYQRGPLMHIVELLSPLSHQRRGAESAVANRLATTFERAFWDTERQRVRVSTQSEQKLLTVVFHSETVADIFAFAQISSRLRIDL